MGGFLKLVVACTALLCLAIGGAYWTGRQMAVSPGPLEQPKAVIVPRGLGVSGVAEVLKREGVIRNALIFRMAFLVDPDSKPLRAGEYEIPARVSVVELLGLLQSGKTVQRRLTVPEGLSAQEIVALIRAAPALTGDIRGMPAEGELLPETYFYSAGDSREDVVRRMREAMVKTIDELWRKRTRGLPYDNARQALILASIVEKETGKPDERARIAGALVNRLRARMPLQSDPTVVYALVGGGSLGRELTRADLTFQSPYNTYVTQGLPPGPICSPGRAAIEAALNPATTRELYFVADGTGGHAFAENLQQHNRNVERWRQIQRERQERGQPPSPAGRTQTQPR